MRPDFAKLLVQTPRRAGKGVTYKRHRTRTRLIAEDEVAAPLGMRTPYNAGYVRKEFDEYFAPLLRMLNKNVGRPWDKIYSELSKSLNGGGTVIEHVKVHLRQFVITDALESDRDGIYGHYRKFGDGFTPLYKGQLFVNKHGLLARAKAPPAPPKEEPPVTFVQLPGEEAYVRHHGVWYWARMAPLFRCTEEDKNVTKRDVFLGEFTGGVRNYGKGMYALSRPEWAFCASGKHDVWHCLRELYGGHRGNTNGSYRYAVEKRQLNSKEIKRAGLP